VGACVKSLFKVSANYLSAAIVFPAVCLYRLIAKSIGDDRTFPGWSQAISLIPGFTGIYLRRAFYSHILLKYDPGTCISFGSTISHPTAEIGRNVYVGLFCSLGSVIIEDEVLVSSHVSIINGGNQHGTKRLDIPTCEQPGIWKPITIGRDSWIGERSIVMADVGKHCVVGAGTVVTKPVPDFAVVLGSPARIVRYRDGRELVENASV